MRYYCSPWVRCRSNPARARQITAKNSENQRILPLFPRARCHPDPKNSAAKRRSMADNSMAKQQKQRGRGRPFEKGQSGNLAGRPRGSRNRATQAMQQLLDGEARALTRKAVELALGGDTTALRMCLDRLLAPRRDRRPSREARGYFPQSSRYARLRAASAATGEAQVAGLLIASHCGHGTAP